MKAKLPGHVSGEFFYALWFARQIVYARLDFARVFAPDFPADDRGRARQAVLQFRHSHIWKLEQPNAHALTFAIVARISDQLHQLRSQLVELFPVRICEPRDFRRH